VETVTAIDFAGQGCGGGGPLEDCDTLGDELGDFDGLFECVALRETVGDDELALDWLEPAEEWLVDAWLPVVVELPVVDAPPPPRIAPQTHHRMSRTRMTTTIATSRRTQYTLGGSGPVGRSRELTQCRLGPRAPQRGQDRRNAG
jgi:hypothetical protein